MFKRIIAALICVTFSFSNLQYVYAQDFSVNQLPVPGTMVGESAPFAPLALKGIVVNPQKPLEFQFIVDTGKGPQDTVSIKDQANQLVKYFLAGLTIPEGDLWVNLSPYEKNRMVPAALGQTDLGRDLLAQDYILKQLTASLIYPEKDLGKAFWSRVYAKAQAQFGTTNVPVNTFNKVWILPDQAQVFENINAAYVTKATLKVMLDEDYLALQKHSPLFYKEGLGEFRGSSKNTHSLASNIVRAIILPEIEKEVNTGKNFAPLRQIYQALILAKWYKETIQNGLLDAVYTNKNKITGVNLNDPAVKEQIYNRYLQAYKKGAFNYIKEDPAPDGQVVPRKYFSGGTSMAMTVDRTYDSRAMLSLRKFGALVLLAFALVPIAKPVLAQNTAAPTASSPQTQTSVSPVIIPYPVGNNVAWVLESLYLNQMKRLYAMSLNPLEQNFYQIVQQASVDIGGSLVAIARGTNTNMMLSLQNATWQRVHGMDILLGKLRKNYPDWQQMELVATISQLPSQIAALNGQFIMGTQFVVRNRQSNARKTYTALFLMLTPNLYRVFIINSSASVPEIDYIHLQEVYKLLGDLEKARINGFQELFPQILQRIQNEADSMGPNVNRAQVAAPKQILNHGALNQAMVHHLSDGELKSLRELPAEADGFISKRLRDDRRIKNQITQIESALGHSLEVQERISQVMHYLNEDPTNFKGEEVHVLSGTSVTDRVIGRIDRKIAERFGYAHETANVVLLDPEGNIVFQTMRNKDNYDDHLSVYGGHLTVGQTHVEGALEETKQESRLENFTHPMQFLGYESYDEQGDTNRERRSWFVQRLTQEEWEKMKLYIAEDEREAGANKLTDDRETYKRKLAHLWKEGRGEVSGFYSFSVKQIEQAPQKENPASKLTDKINRYLPITDNFQGKPVTIDSFFTPDSLDRLVKNRELWGKIKIIVKEDFAQMSEKSQNPIMTGNVSSAMSTLEDAAMKNEELFILSPGERVLLRSVNLRVGLAGSSEENQLKIELLTTA